MPPVYRLLCSYNRKDHVWYNAVINDGLENKEGVIVAGMLRLVCVRGTQHDSILLHLGVRTVGGSQSSTGKISSPTGQNWEHPATVGVLGMSVLQQHLVSAHSLKHYQSIFVLLQGTER